MISIKNKVFGKVDGQVSQLQQEKDVWRLILEDKADDLKSLLQEDQRDRLDKFQIQLIEGVHNFSRRILNQAMRLLNAIDFNMFDDPAREKKKNVRSQIRESKPSLGAGN